MESRLDRERTSVNRADLHVAILPQEAWIQKLNYASFQSISDAVSLGFIRIDPEITLSSIRHEISRQIRFSNAFTFLRHVGRALVVVSRKQEGEMKGKHYLPPHSSTYEILILPGSEHLYIRKSLEFETADHNLVVPILRTPRENTFDACRRILERLTEDGLIEREFADLLLAEAENSSEFAKTLKYLDDQNLLEDVLKFFETDEQRLEFMKWLSGKSNLEDYISQMAEDPFQTIKQFYIQNGTFLEDGEQEETEEIKLIKEKHRRYIWGNAKIKRRLNTGEKLQRLENKFEKLRNESGVLKNSGEPSFTSSSGAKRSHSQDRHLHTTSQSHDPANIQNENLRNNNANSKTTNSPNKYTVRSNSESSHLRHNSANQSPHKENSSRNSYSNFTPKRKPHETANSRKVDHNVRSSGPADYRNQNHSEGDALFRKQEEVHMLTQTRRRRRQIEDKRQKVAEQDRIMTDELLKGEDRRNQLLQLIQLELDREKRLEKDKQYHKNRPKDKKNVISGAGSDPLLQSHRERAVQLAAAIQNTKDIISVTKLRLDQETGNRHKVEAHLRRVRSEMTRAKINQNKTFRSQRKV